VIETFGSDRFEHLQQLAGIGVDRTYVQTFKYAGESPFHQCTIFQNIGNAGWHTQIVFEDIDLAVAVANKVGSCNVTPDSLRWIDAPALRPVERCRQDDFLGNDFVFEDLLVVIDIVDEFVQSADTLNESAFDPRPFLCAGYSGNQVEGKDFFRACGISIDIEGDAQLKQKLLGGMLRAGKCPSSRDSIVSSRRRASARGFPAWSNISS